ncbi:aldo/keto reductase [Catenulispora pinisilvae]|uniref:aldo/keto reductase n=1 Tax=Catenulispora pinisilvae TaxID=2705253 RepID=UPI001891B7F7|nr:aldo/keto reductase [Catenulispora pinisilvae]
MEYTTFGGAAGPRVSTLALGAMMMGTRIDEPTSFAILDRFREAGGTFLDTADCYAFWVDGATGHESEDLLGRWLAARGCRAEMVIATKVGAQPDPAYSAPWPRDAEGLSAPAIRTAAEGSLARLGTDHVEVLFAHIEDKSVTFAETAGAFGELIAAGKAAVAGVSNHPTPHVKRARAAAEAQGVPGYTAVQQRHAYLRAVPGASFTSPQEPADDELLAMVRGGELSMMAYATLLEGSLVRADRPLSREYQSPENQRRLEIMWRIADGAGVTRTQLALAWLLSGDPAIVPVVGVSSVAQLDDVLGAVDVPRAVVTALAEAVAETPAEAGV